MDRLFHTVGPWKAELRWSTDVDTSSTDRSRGRPETFFTGGTTSSQSPNDDRPAKLRYRRTISVEQSSACSTETGDDTAHFQATTQDLTVPHLMCRRTKGTSTTADLLTGTQNYCRHGGATHFHTRITVLKMILRRTASQ